MGIAGRFQQLVATSIEEARAADGGAYQRAVAEHDPEEPLLVDQAGQVKAHGVSSATLMAAFILTWHSEHSPDRNNLEYQRV